MPRKHPLILMLAALVAVSIILIKVGAVQAASREKAVQVFNGTNGSCPSSNLLSDTAGNLYGTTFGDGGQACFSGNGTVFKLTRNINGSWTYTLLHQFSGNDGANPYAGLISDQSGNLYGTTWVGGDSNYGTVFELSPGANSTWTETVLHSFGGYPDGANPHAGLIFDASGTNLYGTAWDGGEFGCGNVFKLAPQSNGQWIETVLHSFNCKDGWIPYAGLTFDSEGNLYGATPSAGNFSYCNGNGCGSVFKLTSGSNGTWTYTALHYFRGADGAGPVAGLVFEGGNLYGTTETGGDLSACSGLGCGTVFKLSPGANGQWTETVLHAFNGNDGSSPESTLVFDTAGNLYGTTTGGGGGSLGTVFKLSPNASGSWTRTVLLQFSGKNGANPSAGLIFGQGASLYGTTMLGANLNACAGPYGSGCGLVFAVAP